MLKKILSILTFFLLSSTAFSQSVSGTLSLSKNDTIRLYGFNGFENYPIQQIIADKNGVFSLKYTKNDIGMGYVMASDNKPYFLVLSGEDIEIKGEALSYPETIQIIKGKENQWFEQFADEHPRREQALNAWDYLEKIYRQDPLFSSQKTPNQAIQQEKKRIKKEDADFLSNLPKDSYISYYLPIRTLVSSVSTIAQYRTTEIPVTIEAFRKIDYSDNRLFKSGLYKDVLDNQIWFLENSGKAMDEMYLVMNQSIDAIIQSLTKDEEKLNLVTSHLFDLLEQHSLFKASEYLATKVLNDDECGCSIQSDVADKLEQYRVMKIGNIAPEITFPKDVVYKGNKQPKKLSEMESEYTLVFFGSSWCQTCSKEIPQILPLYNKWKSKGVEVLFVSLDTDKQAFQNFVSVFSFVSICDFQKWESPIIKDYHVSGTPTMYLLKKNQEILSKPNSIQQVDAWVDWVLK